MKRFLVAAVAAVSCAVSLATPAQANHTLCDDEPSDLIVADLNTPGEVYFCVAPVLVVVRTNRVGVTVCTYYTPGSNSSDDICPIVT